MPSSKRRSGASPKEAAGRRGQTAMVLPESSAPTRVLRLRHLDRGGARIAGSWEVIAWVFVAAVAIGIRLINLDGAPLQPSESVLAMDSWSILHHQGIQIAPSPLLIYLNTLLFLILGSSDAVARALPCLAGVAISMSPLVLRHRLGRIGALVAAAVLATSPTLVFASRLVDPVLVTVALGLGLVLAVENYTRVRRRSYLVFAAVLAGFLLLSGPLACDLLVILIGFAVIYRSEMLHPERINAPNEVGLLDAHREWMDEAGSGVERDRASGGSTRLLIFLAGTVLLLGSGLGTNLVGVGESLAAPLAAWAASLDGTGVHQAWLFPSLLLGFEPAALIAGIAGSVIAFREEREFGVFLAWWATIGFLLLVISAGDPTWTALVVVPLGMLSGFAGDGLASTLANGAQRKQLAIFAAVALPLVATCLIAFGYVTLPDPAIPPIVALAPPVALIAFAASFTLGYDRRAALTAIGSVAMICLVAFSIHVAVLLAPGGALDPAPPFVDLATSADVRNLTSDLGTILDELGIAQQIEGLNVNRTVEVSRKYADPLRWYLRNEPDVKVVDQITDSPGVAIVDATAKPPRGSYEGETFQFSVGAPLPTLNPGDLWRWWIYHETGTRIETYVKVYVKTQLARP